jgi:hypothetical protein
MLPLAALALSGRMWSLPRLVPRGGLRTYSPGCAGARLPVMTPSAA